MAPLSETKALTFDLFGTVLDLGGSLTPHIAELLHAKGSEASPQTFWNQWRGRQRIEQYQDTIMMLGRSPYLEVARRAFVWTLKLNNLELSEEEVRAFMENWQQLSPFPEVVPALERLTERYKLVALSNGEPRFLEHLAENRIGWSFDTIISGEVAGAFKPHPGIYRRAANILGLEVGECVMVSSNSFDVVGARTCGFRGAFIDRYGLPYEDTPYLPDVTVRDFTGLADALL